MSPSLGCLFLALASCSPASAAAMRGAPWHMPAHHRCPPPAAQLADQSAAATGSAAPPSAPFEEWAESNLINAPKLAITGVEELRGVIAIEPIAVGEELCVVPRTSCLDLAAVEGAQSPCPDLVPTSLWTTLRWFERLACWLIAERRRGADSPVSGYIGYLPRPETFADAPQLWSSDELDELRYPPLKVAVLEEVAQIEALHATLRSQGGPIARTLTFEELRWAQQLVLSRAFSSQIATPKQAKSAAAAPPAPPPATPASTAAKAWLGGLPIVGKMVDPDPPPPPPAAGDSLEMAMMPMLDAFNHRSAASTSCAYDGERNAFVLTANREIRRGEQAFLSYGTKSNDELLQLFGFVEEGNPHDTFLSIGLEEYLASQVGVLFASDAELQRRFARLEQLKLADALVCELRATGAPPECMGALRVLLASASEVEDDARKLATSAASLETEVRVWGALRAYSKLARSAMGGSRKMDLKEASQARRTAPRRALALTLRAEKKRVLSELESRLNLVEARSRKAGKVVKGALAG